MVKGNRDGSWVFEGWERNRVTGRDVGIGRNVCTSKEEGEREKCAALVLTSHSTSLHSQQIILYNINSSDTMPSTDTSSHPCFQHSKGIIPWDALVHHLHQHTQFQKHVCAIAGDAIHALLPPFPLSRTPNTLSK